MKVRTQYVVFMMVLVLVMVAGCASAPGACKASSVTAEVVSAFFCPEVKDEAKEDE